MKKGTKKYCEGGKHDFIIVDVPVASGTFTRPVRVCRKCPMRIDTWK